MKSIIMLHNAPASAVISSICSFCWTRAETTSLLPALMTKQKQSKSLLELIIWNDKVQVVKCDPNTRSNHFCIHDTEVEYLFCTTCVYVCVCVFVCVFVFVCVWSVHPIKLTRYELKVWTKMMLKWKTCGLDRPCRRIGPKWFQEGCSNKHKHSN